MNKELEDVENQIKEEEEKYLDKFANISEQQMQLYMNMLWCLDSGFSGCMTNSWGMIGYTPFVELNPSLWVLSEFGQRYVLTLLALGGAHCAPPIGNSYFRLFSNREHRLLSSDF